MDVKSFLQSNIFRRVLWGIGAVIVLLIVFKAGELVGFRKASFSYRWGEQYYRSFAGPRKGFFGDFRGGDFLASHGTFGSIINVASSTLVMEGGDGEEKVVLLDKGTVVKRFRDTVPAAELKENDRIVVIGSPDENGRIKARFVRVVEASSSLPQPNTN